MTDTTNLDYEAILLYALRYAIGRQTFAPSDVQAAIRRQLPIQDRGVREAMIRDIETAQRIPGGLGDERIDAPGWNMLLVEIQNGAFIDRAAHKMV